MSNTVDSYFSCLEKFNVEIFSYKWKVCINHICAIGVMYLIFVQQFVYKIFNILNFQICGS